MKLFLLLITLTPVTLVAQKIVLIDREFKRPVQFTDSATTEHLLENYFPIHVADLRSVLQKTGSLITYIDEGRTGEIMESNMVVGNSTFIYTESGSQRHPLHKIVLSTRTSALSTSLKLVFFNDSRKRAIQRLVIFTDYIRNNMAVSDEANRDF